MGAWPSPCAAQLEASLDATASRVHYDGYLASAAASLSPALSWWSPRSTLAARGTVLVFESGHTSLQGLLTASTLSASNGPLRLEAGTEAGASSYAQIARFAHALGRLRLHLVSARCGLWLGPLGGETWYGGAGRRAWGGTTGAWVRSDAGSLDLAWTYVMVGDTTYGDLEARGRWRRGALVVAGSAGSLASKLGGPADVYGNLTVSLQVSTRVAIVLGAGSYPSDPLTGNVAGRFVTAGLHLGPRPRGQPAPAPVRPERSDAAPDTSVARATLAPGHNGSVLVVSAPGASIVEVKGDFTGWDPVALEATGRGRFRYPPALAAGVYRFDVRVDGGSWAAPAGVSIAPDEFGGEVGVLAVP